MKTKVQNSTKMSICHRTVNYKKIWNVPLDALICPLQIINDIEPLLLTLHGLNACFIHHPSNVKNYSIGYKSETAQPKKKKKRCIRVTYFYTFLPILGSKFKIPTATEIGQLFRHLINRYSIGYKSETAQPKKKKKRCIRVTYFYTFLPILGSKFKIPTATEIGQLFRHLINRHLTAQQMV